MEDQVPTVGRIVHFNQGDGIHLAAVVAKVYSPTCVNLGIFSDFGTVSGLTSVLYDGSGEGLATWHWPERA